VRWRLIDAGAGVASWTISSKTLGQKGAKYVSRAHGTHATSALVKLAPGISYALELTVTDRLGRSTTSAIGNVLVPQDDRSNGALRYAGSWRHVALARAWYGGVSEASAGASVSANLPAGRPVFELRENSREAHVELSDGAQREVLTVGRARAGALWLLAAPARSHAGAVTLRVISGTADLDGVGVEP
jgi:(2Fe-2S) ferredoxin